MSNTRSLIFKALLPLLFMLSPGGAFPLRAEEPTSPFSTPEFAEARKLVREGKAECVLIRGKALDVKRGRGVMPLLEFHDRQPNEMKGAVIVDKVIGRAAAAVAISGGVRAVHGEVMSEDGKAYLEKHGIPTNHGLLVPRILNADRSGLCPLEKSVEGIDDPERALAALRRRIAEFKNPRRGDGGAKFYSRLRKSWKQAGLSPVRAASDAAFLRRARLKLTGRPPAPDEVRRFLDDKSPDKRVRLIARLIDSPEFADMMAMRYCQMFRVKSEFPINMWPNAVQLFHAYLRDAAARDMRYDRMVRELLTTSGSNFRKPQVNFLRGHADRTPEGVAKGVLLSLAGVRLEKLPEAERKGVAAFFGRLGYKATDEWKEEIVFTLAEPAEFEARTLDGKVCRIKAPEQEPRRVFADWLVSGKNPYFARAFANRMWFWFMGRGLVEPADDLVEVTSDGKVKIRTTVELDALAEAFRNSGYSVKALARIICRSPAFNADWRTTAKDQAKAEELFAVYPVHRLEPEVFIDLLAAVTGDYDRYRSVIPEPFTILPPRTPAVKIADGSISSGALDNFGRSPRDSGRLDETRLHITSGQRQWLLNSNILFARLRRAPQRIFAKRDMGFDRRVDELYLLILSRYPTKAERAVLRGRFDETPKKQRGKLWGDIVWALVNTREFMLYH